MDDLHISDKLFDLLSCGSFIQGRDSVKLSVLVLVNQGLLTRFGDAFNLEFKVLIFTCYDSINDLFVGGLLSKKFSEPRILGILPSVLSLQEFFKQWGQFTICLVFDDYVHILDLVYIDRYHNLGFSINEIILCLQCDRWLNLGPHAVLSVPIERGINAETNSFGSLIGLLVSVLTTWENLVKLIANLLGELGGLIEVLLTRVCDC